MLPFDELWERLVHQDEGVEIEAKSGTQVGDAALETISAFSNEPHRDGGYLLFGIRVKAGTLFPEYEIVGVADPDKLQTELASRCNAEFNHPIRPEILRERRNGRTVVVAYIPEAPAQQKPILIKKRGQQHGAFRRIGSADVLCSEEDIAYFYQERTHQSYDETPVREAGLGDLAPDMLQEYRRIRAEVNPNAAELRYSDEDLLYALHAATQYDGRLVPTIAGILTFGGRSAIRRFFPSMRVDYIRVEGREWVPDPERRYQAVEILEPLLRAIPRAISQIVDDLPSGFHLSSGQDRRRDVPLIPRDAIREVVVNALMHRNYRTRGPVQIIRYSNRMEIRNPGISLVPDDRLGEPGSITRNEKIAALLHETQYAETKGTGIRTVRELMDRHGLAPPFFESDRSKDTFSVTFLFHHLLGPGDLSWLDQFRACQLSPEEKKALIFVREVGAINNAAYRDINKVDTLTASGNLRRLRELGLLQQKGQSRATYYVPTEKTLQVHSGERLRSTELGPGSCELATGSTGLQAESTELATGSTELQAESTELTTTPAELCGLPPELLAEIRATEPMATEGRVKRAILRLCAVRMLTAAELGRLLERHPLYVRYRFLRPLVQEGLLAYRYPGSPTHPRQAYQTVRIPEDD
ncbi:MAG: putative DNA binding domain-containing protein [Armatimonadetes bacterium]|nr:putative DNA binding domain-containing protein [Armatimonadota bacterium]